MVKGLRAFFGLGPGGQEEPAGLPLAKRLEVAARLRGIIKQLQDVTLPMNPQFRSNLDAAAASADTESADEVDARVDELEGWATNAVTRQLGWIALAPQLAVLDDLITRMQAWGDGGAAGLADQLREARQAAAEWRFMEAVNGAGRLGATVPALSTAAFQARYGGETEALGIQIARMQGWGDPRAAGLAASAAAVQGMAARQEFPAAEADLATLRGTVPAQYAQARLLQEHAAGMAALVSRLAVADAVQPHVAANPAAGPLWTTYAAARAACPERETDPARAPGLAAARATLDAAARGLTDQFKSGPGAPADWLSNYHDTLFDGTSALIQKAREAPVTTNAQSGLRRQLDASEAQYDGATSLQDRIAALEAWRRGAEDLLAATPSTNPDEARFFLRHKQVVSTLQAAAAARPRVPAPVRDGFDQASTAFLARRNHVPPDFVALLADLETLAAASDAVLTSSSQAATADIRALTANAAANPDGTAVSHGSAALVLQPSMDPWTLAFVSLDDKLQLAAALQRDMPPFDSNNPATANEPRRQAQRKLFAAMDLDEDFVRDDRRVREAVVTALTSDPADLRALQDTRDDWTVLPPADRLAVLDKVMRTQSTALGCSPPAGGVVLTALGPGQIGVYKPDIDTIQMTTEPRFLDDFELCVNMLFHENTHCYQRQLVAAAASLPPTDPKRRQAGMFAANQVRPGSYVHPDEDRTTYMKQPKEEHAWDAGADFSRQLTRALSAPRP